tara:strand:- start:115 stop:750 length:636 start_codon:yes stop_codon:yes gene_type:complete
MNHSKDHKIIEALIFGSNEPITEDDMCDKISDKSKLSKILNDIQQFYKDQGVNLIKTGDRWSFRTSAELYDKLIILKKQKRKMSKASMEVLSIIAYNQPITRAEIENIRGVQTGRGSIDILLELSWIKPKGRRNTPGRPVTWVTTEKFLDHFSLENINSLPNIEELKANGFLDKRPAISTITDLADSNNFEPLDKEDEDDNLDDFINPNIN